jgi:uncharacterized Zn-binding protein involved in type VI secretion
MPAGTFLPPGLTTSDVKITSGGTDNYVMTAVDGETIQGESKLTFDGSTLTLDGDLTFTGAQTISTSSGDLTLTAGGSTGDVLIGDGDGTILYVDGGVGSLGFGTAAVGRRLISIGGSYTSDGSSDSAGVLYSAVNLTAANGDTAAHIGGWFANTFTTQDNSEIIDLVAQVGIYGKAITTGTDTVTNAATLYINEAMSGAGTGNYALWVGAGTSRFDGNIDLNNTGTLLNVGASGNDWTANDIRMSSENSTGTNQVRITNTGTGAWSRARVLMFATESENAGCDALWTTSIYGVASWHGGIDNSEDDRFAIGTDNLGSSDAFRIAYATHEITFDVNQGANFGADYVCDGCGAGRLEMFACCGTVAWHDDVMALRESYLSPAGIQHMAKLGIYEIDGPDKDAPGWMGINYQKAQHMTWAGMFQNRQRMDAQYDRLDERLARIEEAIGV